MAQAVAAASTFALLSLPDVSKAIALATETLEKRPATSKRSRDVIPFHCNLAPSFGKLKDGGAIKQMDEELKVIIAGTTRAMSKLVQDAKDYNRPIEWSDVVTTMTQTSFLEPSGDVIHRADKLIKSSTNFFKLDGSADPTIVKEVMTWFVELIKDDDVLRDTKIDIHHLGVLVGESGARVNDLETLVYNQSFVESKVLDIGVLRYPDLDNPYFKVYRIQLTAWKKCERLVFVQDDSNGITGEFTCRKYKPRTSVIKGMSERVIKKAVQEAEDLFA